MDKPSAASVARSCELSMFVLEAIASVADLLNQSPEEPDQLLLVMSRLGIVVPAVFLAAGHPLSLEAPTKFVLATLAPSPRLQMKPSFPSLAKPLDRLRAEAAGIAVAQHRFYDLPDFSATLIQMSAKSCAEGEPARRSNSKKTWLTLFGYRSLIDTRPYPDLQGGSSGRSGELARRV